MIYICERNDQCMNSPCNECYYTTCFLNSKLYNNKIKPKDSITFIKDIHGDFWEMSSDPNLDKNLPESMRATPLTLIHKSYDQIAKEEGW